MEQPSINIGLLGHVANGKSSLVRAITGEKTSRGDSRCMQKGESREMTIQVGYSNAKIYKCNCPVPDCYVAQSSEGDPPKCEICNMTMNLIKHVSFVDNPGHRSLMTNMLSGSMVIDTAILVIDSNKDCPQIQTLEHLLAAEIIGIGHYTAITQNKIDLILNETDRKELLTKNKNQIVEFVSSTAAESTPIIPTCMSPAKCINLKYVLQAIVERAVRIPDPIYNRFPLFIHCVRSFDINKPCPANKIRGGVIGGTIMTGELSIGDIIEIRGTRVGTLQTQVVSLFTGTTPLDKAHPGGLIGIGTTLDPGLTRADGLVGACAGHPGTLPKPIRDLALKIKLLSRGIGHDAEKGHAVRLIKGDTVQIAVGAMTVNAQILTKNKREYVLQCDRNVHPIDGQTIPVSKYISGSWTIIGRGIYGESIERKFEKSIDNFNYENLLEKILQSPIQKISDKNLSTPKLTKDGGARLIWENFEATCKELNRSATHLQEFFTEELACQTSINIIGQLVIHGKNRYNERHIQKILVEYIKNFVQCTTCKSLSTKLEKTKKHLRLLCAGCGAEHLR